MRRCRRSGFIAALMLLASGHAGAQDTTIPATVTQPYTSEAWSEGRTRLFFAGSASLGSAARSDVAVGYGKPHWAWIGVESAGGSTGEFAFTSLRARLALVYADLAVGWGRVWSYKRTTLPRLDRYTDLPRAEGEDADYKTLSLWLFGAFPVLHGYVEWELEAARLHGLGEREAVYEEHLRAVVFPTGWVLAGRLGYAYQFARKQGAIGAIGEVLLPGDRDAYIARVGPMASWSFSPRLDLALTATAVVHSPDALGFYRGLWGTVRARYRFASR